MDRSWITTSKLGEPEYNAGVMDFIRFALANNTKRRDKLPCPCYMCHNLMHHKADVILRHLSKWEFDRTYTCWHRHGEKRDKMTTSDHHGDDTTEGDKLENMMREHEKIVDDNPEVVGELLSDTEKPLYNGSIKYNKLSAILKLYNIKVGHGSTDQSFTALLELLKDVLPSENLLPSSTYEALFKIQLAKGFKESIFNLAYVQNEQFVTLDYEDMLDWCFQREIGSSHMSILMMYLSDMVHAIGISALYGFCDCNYRSPLTPTNENEDD